MKNDLRIAVTKRMIKESLLSLLKEKPLSKIKVSELCERSGINRATFYRHYETLQDALQEIETDFIHQMPRPERSPKNIEEAQQHMEAVCTYLYENSDMVKLLFLDKNSPDLVECLDHFYHDILSSRSLELPFPEDTVQILISFWVGGCQSLMRKWILDDIHKTPAQIAEILCHVIRWPQTLPFPD